MKYMKHTEVAGAELIGGTDLGSGFDSTRCEVRGAHDAGERHDWREPSPQAMASKTLHAGRSHSVPDPQRSPSYT
jgi:hypothetical protein